MSKTNKVLACIQILVFLTLLLCSGGITINPLRTSEGFPCKEHVCGCKSEADCKAHCCCSPQGNQPTSQQGIKKQKTRLQSFISSLKCKSGNDAITFINTHLKYLLDDKLAISQIAFLYFLTNNNMVHLCEPAVSPPEKPPRCHA